MTKKEKALYEAHGIKWDIVKKRYITICDRDVENIIKVHEKLVIEWDYVILKRITKKYKLLFGYYLYINDIYGGISK